MERGFTYTSNAFDDDLPYWSREEQGLVVVPYSLDTNDMKFFHPNGFVNSEEMVTYVRDAFETLQREAQRGKTRLLNIGFHLRIAGRPARFQAFRNILAFLSERRNEIYLATRQDIACAFADAVPNMA
ncbi:peptidoglycan/xylan/chitin deacetylase (PgdA/CDA1 family) [Pararhizobium capsulatum DSM 1112]|uniref:Peptidoglycan/xylan/chitin deacetylase (PgdA/CDA1 family) n=1 Tax=Pararhizobium capsulatum DSM 1112 TaxID=1121113 RepID=A0ABU0C151_9HYPH|nr:peptidoglycan/xylan/chitin deacetylase (PgdA/CDA1 family) [Pararhizobium capsulatum DSM 1112]